MTTRRSILSGLSGLIGAGVLAGCERGSPERSGPGEPVDVIFYGGEIVTMDPARPSAQALGVRGEQIVAVGTEPDVLAFRGSATRMIDLGGRALLPGFNDSHGHWLGDPAQPWRMYGSWPPTYATVKEAIAATLMVGWTSLEELFVSQERLDELRALDQAGELRLRVNAYLPVNFLRDHFGIWFDQYRPGQTFSANLRIAGAKIFVDRARRRWRTCPPRIATGPAFWARSTGSSPSSLRWCPPCTGGAGRSLRTPPGTVATT